MSNGFCFVCVVEDYRLCCHKCPPHLRHAVGAAGPHDARDHVYRDREDDGGVVLGRDAVQGLKIPELEGGWAVRHHLRRVPESSAGLVFPLGGDHLIIIIILSSHCHHYHDHLGPGLPGGLSLGSHGPHQLLRNPE